MSADQWAITGIAAGWAFGACGVGLGVVWLLRGRSLRWLTGSVAVIAVAAVLAAMIGTAQAMFLSPHDFSVVVLAAAVAGLVAAVGAAGVGAVLAHWSEGLRADARRFGESGTFSGTVGRGPAELQAISEELARTATRLEESRVRERRLEDSRRELVAWVSHDLRTPLAGLRAMTEALEDGLAEDPARYHRQIRSEVDRMVRMVDDLFELSRIQAGALRLSLEPLLVGDLVSEALASADPVARARGVRLGGSAPDGLTVVGDAAGLSRVVANLVMNAIRHTPVDGVVQVIGRVVPDAVEIEVRDACGGLSPEDMERAFDMAWQGSNARTPDAGALFGSGAGLGLAIVKGIVEAHQGSVAVANQDPGCRFLVRLPVAA